MENIRLLCLPLEQFQDALFYPHLFQRSNWPLILMKLLSMKALSLPCFSLQGIPPRPSLFCILLQLSWLFPKYLLSFPSHNSLFPFYSQIWGLFFPGFLFQVTKSSLRVGSTTKQGDAQCSTAGHQVVEFWAGFLMPFIKLPQALKFSAKRLLLQNQEVPEIYSVS